MILVQSLVLVRYLLEQVEFCGDCIFKVYGYVMECLQYMVFLRCMDLLWNVCGICYFIDVCGEFNYGEDQWIYR